MPVDLAQNEALRRRLRATLLVARTRAQGAYDVVVTCNEVNDRHGTGVLVQRLFPDHRRVLSIRTCNHYGGEQAFGDIQLVVPEHCSDRASIYRWTLAMTDGLPIDRVVCVPFHPTELIVSMALRDAYQVPFCLYVMDDQNVHAAGISDALMDEAIARASLRLAISSDMRDLYQVKFGRRFWIAAPTISPGLSPVAPPAVPAAGSAVLVGNVWGRSWLELLRRTVSGAGLQVDWFCNAPGGGWSNVEASELLDDGIRLVDPLPEPDLARRLGEYEVALVPTAPVAPNAENWGVASLSLPTRIPFLIGASNLPIIVLGDARTCAARFVTHFGIGVACDYDPDLLASTLRAVADAGWRASQGESLAQLRDTLDGEDWAGWLRGAIDSGRPPSLRFESLQVLPPLTVTSHIDDSPALGPWLLGFDGVLASFRRLAAAGYQPAFVVDVGASTGVWSEVVARVFPDARYVLVEPLRSRYPEGGFGGAAAGNVSLVESAVGAAPGTAVLHVDQNLFGSSLFADSARGGAVEAIEVPVTTLDVLAEQLSMAGGGVLKLDIQGGELAALEGGRRFLEEVDVVVVEVTFDPVSEAMPSFTQLHSAMEDLGFVYYDDLGAWRDPVTGTLLQKDVMYVRRTGVLAAARRAVR